MENESLRLALSKPADYSADFTEVVEELCIYLSQTLGLKFHHGADMNYRSSQTIDLRLDKAYEPVNNRRDAFFEIDVFISSRGRFFATRCWARDTTSLKRVWTSIPNVETDQNIQPYIKKIDKVLEENGYASLPDEVLSQIAGDHKTRLDKLPATVFQVLFSELN